MGANEGDEWLKYIVEMSMDELWLRDPRVLHDEEFHTYERLMPYFMSDLENFSEDIPIITEGAAFLPYLVDQLQIDNKHYLCVVPTKEFQVNQYKKRLWVNQYLSSCSNREKAFNNWMKREIMFASSVLEQARNIGYKTLIVDGFMSLNENLIFIEEYFCL
jgi:NifB/MoaA-like Fe-S oxidoreductase